MQYFTKINTAIYCRINFLGTALAGTDTDPTGAYQLKKRQDLPLGKSKVWTIVILFLSDKSLQHNMMPHHTIHFIVPIEKFVLDSKCYAHFSSLQENQQIRQRKQTRSTRKQKKKENNLSVHVCLFPRVVQNAVVVPAVGSEEHILQCMRGAVGCGDEAEKKEDEVGHAKQLSQLFVDDLFPERHLLLRVPPEPVPTNDVLCDRRNTSLKCIQSNSVSLIQLTLGCVTTSTREIKTQDTISGKKLSKSMLTSTVTSWNASVRTSYIN